MKHPTPSITISCLNILFSCKGAFLVAFGKDKFLSFECHVQRGICIGITPQTTSSLLCFFLRSLFQRGGFFKCGIMDCCFWCPDDNMGENLGPLSSTLNRTDHLPSPVVTENPRGRAVVRTSGGTFLSPGSRTPGLKSIHGRGIEKTCHEQGKLISSH